MSHDQTLDSADLVNLLTQESATPGEPASSPTNFVVKTWGRPVGIRQLVGLDSNGEEAAIVASLPYLIGTQRHRIEIVRVEVAADQLQLRVVGDILLGLDGREVRHRIAFYDVAGPLHAAHYRLGARHEFRLSAIASSIWQPRPHPGREYPPFLNSLVQRMGGRSDCFHLRMRVEALEELADAGNSPVWRMCGIVREAEQCSLRLDLFASKHVMDKLPGAGESIRAMAWLTGEFLAPGPCAMVLPPRVPSFEETVRTAADVEPASLWELFGDLDDPAYREELSYIAQFSRPLTWGESDPLLLSMEPLPASEPLFDARVGCGLITCGVRSLALPNFELKELEIASIHPVAHARNSHLIEIHTVEISADRLHGRVVGDWLGQDTQDAVRMPLAFYDTSWHLSRQIVRQGDLCRYGLTAIAYSIAPIAAPRAAAAKSESVQVAHAQHPPSASERVSSGAMVIDNEDRMLLSLSSRGARSDEYWFSGLVVACRKLPGGVIFEDAWEMVLEVIREGSATLQIKVVVTERVLGGSKPPRKGSYIEGTGWMQGHLTTLVRRGR